jgi:hypothetical protein
LPAPAIVRLRFVASFRVGGEFSENKIRMRAMRRGRRSHYLFVIYLFVLFLFPAVTFGSFV